MGGPRTFRAACVGLVALAVALPASASEAPAQRIDALAQKGRELGILADQILVTLDENAKLMVIRDGEALRSDIAQWRANIDDIDGGAFHARLEQAFGVAYARGLDEGRLRRFLTTLQRAILRADLATGGDDVGKREEHRVALYKRISLAFMEAMIQPGPGDRADRFQKLRDIVRSVTEADTLALQAEADDIAAQQKLVADLIGPVPVLGEVFDAIALAQGETLAGEQLGKLDTAITVLGLLPAVGDLAAVMRGNPAVDAALTRFARAVDGMAPDVLRRAAQQVRSTPERLRDLAGLTGRSRGVATNLDDIADLSRQADDAVRAAADGAATAHWQSAVRQGQEQAGTLIDTVQRTGATLDPDVLAAYRATRQHKQAVSALKNSSDVEARGLVSDIETRLFGSVRQTGAEGEMVARIVNGRSELVSTVVNQGDGLVDTAAIGAIRNDLAEALAGRGSAEAHQALGRLRSEFMRQQGGEIGDALRAGDIRIEVFNASNSVPARGTIGMDRDVTYRLVMPDGSRLDVPRGLVEPHYNRALFEGLNPGVRATEDEMRSFARSMDHAVTDHLDLEAYRTYGADTLADVIGREGRALSSGTAESVADTMYHKGAEWLEQAAHAATPELREIARAEAMRQMTKQVDNQILPRVRREGLSVARALPNEVGVAVDLFRRVGAGEISPAQAESGLRAMGMTVEQAFRRIADTLPQIEALKRGAR